MARAPKVADDGGHAASGRPEPIFCTLTGDVVDELALEVQIDEEHSMIILDVKSDGLFPGLQVDAMLDLCRRGLGAVMQLKRQAAGTSDLASGLERPPMSLLP
jgi:hypothetical protein